MKWNIMKIAVINIGCKVNQCECDSLMAGLIARGHEVTDELVFADHYVINTCAVTKEAERKSRQFIGKVKKINPKAGVFVIGCASEKNAEQFEIKGVNYISGTARKDRVLDLIEGEEIFPLPTEYESLPTGSNFRARAYVKIEDGCNNFCSYCVIPYLRGRCRSRDMRSILEECREVSKVTDEIVLTGINISAYGKDIGTSFSELIRNLSEVPARIRLGSLEANIIDEEFLQAILEAGNICPHFHLSLQSGSSEVLKNMNRHYSAEDFAAKVALIRSFFPSAAITTDIIVGFPTETEADFEQTMTLIRRVKYDNLYTFIYSPRSGTKAAAMEPVSSAEEISARMQRLLAEQREISEQFNARFLGRTCRMLAEKFDPEKGLVTGKTREGMNVELTGSAEAVGQMLNVRITGVKNWALTGEFV